MKSFSSLNHHRAAGFATAASTAFRPSGISTFRKLISGTAVGKASRMISLLTISWLAVLAPSSAEAKLGPKVSYRIGAFGDGSAESINFSNTRGGDDLGVVKGRASNPIEARLRDGKYLDFFALGDDPKPTPEFTLTLSKNPRSELLILLDCRGEEIKPLLLDLAAVGVKPGGQYVYNYLTIPITVQCGEKAEPVTIQPEKASVIAPPVEKKSLQTIQGEGPDGEIKKLSSSLYFKDTSMRQVVLCFEKAPSKNPEVTIFSIFDNK